MSNINKTVVDDYKDKKSRKFTSNLLKIERLENSAEFVYDRNNRIDKVL